MEEGRRVLYTPPRPTTGAIRDKLGDRWALCVDDFGVVPEDATDLVGVIVWRNRIFEATGMQYKEGIC